MKFAIVVLFACLALASADIKEKANEITKFVSVVNPDSYNYAYETGGGIKAQEEGALKASALGGEEAIAAEGQFSYISPEGTPIQVTYVADENGFQPQGSHLPTPPPIPALIEKALKYLAANPPAQ